MDALDTAMENLIPASVNGANVNDTGWSPRTDPEGPAAQIPGISLGFGAGFQSGFYQQVSDKIFRRMVLCQTTLEYDSGNDKVSQSC